MMYDLRELTAKYVAAFNARDLTTVGDLIADNFELTDPEVTQLRPKVKVLEYIGRLFENSGKSLSFTSELILVDGDNSAIEFEIRLGDDVFKGIDMITWSNGKMISMRAYLTKVQ